MTTIRSYTTIEQSRKLSEILQIESADMNYFNWDNTTDKPFVSDVHENLVDYTPCWSLAALLDVLKYPSITQDVENKWFITDWTGGYPKSEHGFDSPVDACYEMILKLHKLNLL